MVEQNEHGEVVITLKDVYEMSLETNKKVDKLVAELENNHVVARIVEIEKTCAICKAQESTKKDDKVNVFQVITILTAFGALLVSLAAVIWK